MMQDFTVYFSVCLNIIANFLFLDPSILHNNVLKNFLNMPQK